MEALVTIVEVGAYSERQYQRQDGTGWAHTLSASIRGRTELPSISRVAASY